MDKGSSIIGIVIIALVVLPFVLFYLLKKLKHAKYLNLFSSLAEKEKINITSRELWENKYLLGIDAQGKKLIYMNLNENDKSAEIIDLSRVSGCSVISTDRSHKTRIADNASDRLDLVFSFKDGSPEKSLEFYKSTAFMPTADHFVHAEKWQKIIEANLNPEVNK